MLSARTPLEYIKLIRKISNDFIIIYLHNDNDIIMNLHIQPIIQDGSLDYLQGYTHKCSWIRCTFHTHHTLTTTTTGQFEFRLYILNLQFFKTSVCKYPQNVGRLRPHHRIMRSPVQCAEVLQVPGDHVHVGGKVRRRSTCRHASHV